MTYYCPELCATVFQYNISKKFDIEICDTNCQLDVEEISSSLINIKLLEEKCVAETSISFMDEGIHTLLLT